MTARRYTEEDILSALDSDAQAVLEDVKAGDPGDDDVHWPWSREAAQLIRELQGGIDSMFAARMLALDFMAEIRPSIVADFLIRHMRSGDADKAREAREIAQFFRETSEPIGSLLDRPAAAYDLRAGIQQPSPAPKAARIEWVAVKEQWPPIGVKVLAFGAGKELGGIHANRLKKGGDIGPGCDPELYYWEGGEDFDEVTHWAPMPDMPCSAPEGQSHV